MRFLFSFLFAFVSLSALAQTDTIKKPDCDCNCRDVEFTECRMRRFTSLKVDTVAGRFNFFTNFGFRPLGLREKYGAFDSTRNHPATYLTWDFLDFETGLTRRLYWGMNFGLGIPVGGSYYMKDHAVFRNYEVQHRTNWHLGTNLTLDLFYARRFKVFAMANFQASFNRVNVNRNESPATPGSWLAFIQEQSSSKTLDYYTVLDKMRFTQRDQVKLRQFTAQVQGSLGADFLLSPNGASFRVQAGYQLPLESLTSSWKYRYMEKITDNSSSSSSSSGQTSQDDNTRTYRFKVTNTPFSYLQEGVFVKIGFNWLINKGQTCRKGIRKECCDDYRYSNTPINNNNTNPNPPVVYPRTNPPRTNPPRTTPKSNPPRTTPKSNPPRTIPK